MQGSEMKEIRERLGLERLAFARLLGYTGTDRNDEMRIRRYENQSDKYQIPLYIARLAWLLGELDAECNENPPELWPMMVDENGRVKWPVWPGYEFDHEPDPVHAK